MFGLESVSECGRGWVLFVELGDETETEWGRGRGRGPDQNPDGPSDAQVESV